MTIREAYAEFSNEQLCAMETAHKKESERWLGKAAECRIARLSRDADITLNAAESTLPRDGSGVA